MKHKNVFTPSEKMQQAGKTNLQTLKKKRKTDKPELSTNLKERFTYLELLQEPYQKKKTKDAAAAKQKEAEVTAQRLTAKRVVDIQLNQLVEKLREEKKKMRATLHPNVLPGSVDEARLILSEHHMASSEARSKLQPTYDEIHRKNPYPAPARAVESVFKHDFWLAIKESDPTLSMANQPHLREHCLLNTWGETPCSLHCDLCFCSGCKCPASECPEWESHCHLCEKNKHLPVPDKSADPVYTKQSDINDEEENQTKDDASLDCFAEYKPSVKLGCPHPDPVQETTSLSFVGAPPLSREFEISKHPVLREHIIKNGGLSNLQLETIGAASQRHAQKLPSGERAGFFIGDGAGVGKGRMLAGLVVEHFLSEASTRRAVWVSVSSDLATDSCRDLTDVGCCVEGHPDAGIEGGLKMRLRSVKDLDYAPIGGKKIDMNEGVIFSTYASLIASKKGGGGKLVTTRLQQLSDWLSEGEGETLIMFDEVRAVPLSPKPHPQASQSHPSPSSPPTVTQGQESHIGASEW